MRDELRLYLSWVKLIDFNFTWIFFYYDQSDQKKPVDLKSTGLNGGIDET